MNRLATKMVSAVVAASTVIWLFQAGVQTVISGQARVVDGDGLNIGPARIRIFGIDAPELKQGCNTFAGHAWPCGVVSRDTRDRLIGGKPVECSVVNRDRYGRSVAICKDLGREMVREGMALAYRRYSNLYVADEASARAANRGIWNGTILNPEDWRRGRGRSLLPEKGER